MKMLGWKILELFCEMHIVVGPRFWYKGHSYENIQRKTCGISQRCRSIQFAELIYKKMQSIPLGHLKSGVFRLASPKLCSLGVSLREGKFDNRLLSDHVNISNRRNEQWKHFCWDVFLWLWLVEGNFKTDDDNFKTVQTVFYLIP